MKRIFLRHGSYDGCPRGMRVLGEKGFWQAEQAGAQLASFAAATDTKIVVSNCDRTIETAMFLLNPPAAARAAVAALREAAEKAQALHGERRYAGVELELPFPLCRDCVEYLPKEWSGYQGDLIFVGHEPAAEKLGLKLSEGQFAEF
ncbi:MAG TPA: histidine phosphatase family protein [Candidatus Paceibacterota bacterium]